MIGGAVLSRSLTNGSGSTPARLRRVAGAADVVVDGDVWMRGPPR
jgi:hypothetical protein